MLAFAGRLRDGGCEVFTSDLRVRIDETGLYAYPDLTIVCGPPALSDEHPPALLNPRLVLEVLSESTEAWDLGPKAAHYRHRSSVQALVFVDSRARRVTTQVRNPDASWTLRDQVDGDVEVLGVRIPLDELYRGWSPA